jgi:4-hydroxybenzoyl-CoA thioesterase
MEQLFEPLDGGYAGLVSVRKVGLPAVAVHADFRAPVRYGDVVSIETSVARIGNRSLTLRYVFVRSSDRVHAAELHHTVVTTDLAGMKSCPMPEDVRAIATRHLSIEPARGD